METQYLPAAEEPQDSVELFGHGQDSGSCSVSWNPYVEALKCWGISSQIDMVLEESCELGKALCKLKRAQNPEERLDRIYEVLEEAADVTVMLEQIPYILLASMPGLGSVHGHQDFIRRTADDKRVRLSRIIKEYRAGKVGCA